MFSFVLTLLCANFAVRMGKVSMTPVVYGLQR